ncbi:MAG: hypothetical protein ABIP54_03170 [Candidatus Andersenbacteria bacterium]
MKTLQIKEAIIFGWKSTTKNFWLFAAIVFTLLFISWITGFDSHAMRGSFLLSIVGMLASVYIRLGFANISLYAVDGKPLDFNQLFAVNNKFWMYLGTTVLFMIAVTLGSILLIVPGIIIALMWMMYPYIVLEKNMSIIDGLKESARITKGYKWQLFGFFVIVVLMNIVGAIPFGLGFFVSIPVSAVASAHMYRQLV